MINQEFNSYFESIYDSRWSALLSALQEKEFQICYSPFENSAQNFLENPDRFRFESGEQAQIRDGQGHLKNYILDPASLMPVFALNPAGDSKVLDLCAAPGGKSLAILSALGDRGSLLSNESSPDRARRLKKVLNQYSPTSFQSKSKVVQRDGTKFGFFFEDEFSHILVDVPCSSERHMIRQNRTQEWTLKKSKFLSVKQYTLLCAALITAQAGARIVYSTCSINPVENDEVIRKFLKKKGAYATFEKIEFNFLGAERTEFGLIVLPDRSSFGPIYLSSIRVNS